MKLQALLGLPLRSSTSAQRGQSSVEYVVVCAALAIALGVGMSTEDSVLLTLVKAFRNAYQKISYSLSLPS